MMKMQYIEEFVTPNGLYAILTYVSLDHTRNIIKNIGRYTDDRLCVGHLVFKQYEIKQKQIILLKKYAKFTLNFDMDPILYPPTYTCALIVNIFPSTSTTEHKIRDYEQENNS